MEKLLPERLKLLWQEVDEKRLTSEEYTQEYERLLEEYRNVWKQALLLHGHEDLTESLLAEAGEYTQCHDMNEIRRRCEQAVATLKGEWHAQVRPEDLRSIERFYDQSETQIYELMWWHTLIDDPSPLAYVTALYFARQHGCSRHLDFGAGVGAGGILFARNGFEVSLADISSTLLRFSRWRLEQRQLQATYIDLKTDSLPRHAYDFVTAMDVFEHLVDPVDTVERLWEALRPGGFLYVRIAAEVDEDRPQHVVEDFGPTFARMRDLSLVQVWEDEWLWGHRVFQKS